MLLFKRIFLIGLLILIGIAALLCICAIIVSGMRGNMMEATLISSMLLGILFALSLAAFVAIEQKRFIWLATLGLILCALLALVTPIWAVLEAYRWSWGLQSDFFRVGGKTIFIGYFLAALLNLSALVLTPRFKFPWLLVSYGTVLASLGAVGSVSLLIMFERHMGSGVDDFFAGTSLVSLIAAIAGMFAVFILNKFLATTVLDPVSLPSHKLPISCPRCMTQQDLPMGESRCISCKLKFKIDIEEPKCPTCGYVLHMLTRPICPECGTKLSHEEIPTAIAS